MQSIEHGMKTRLTSKHRDLVDVVEPSVGFAVEARPYICDKDLGPLEKAHFLAFEDSFILEAGEGFGQEVDEGCCGAVCFCNAVPKASIEFLDCLSDVGILTRYQTKDIHHKGSVPPPGDILSALPKAELARLWLTERRVSAHSPYIPLHCPRTQGS